MTPPARQAAAWAAGERISHLWRGTGPDKTPALTGIAGWHHCSIIPPQVLPAY
jgi:hypothetical protein